MFVHLRLHTEFSVVDGTNRIDEIVNAAAADNQPALAISDLNNLFGASSSTRKPAQGVKPVLGAEVMVQGLGRTPPISHASCCCTEPAGLPEPGELLSRAWTRTSSRPRRLQGGVAARAREGLIALAGAQAGPVGQALLQGDEQRAAEVSLELASIFPTVLHRAAAGGPRGRRAAMCGGGATRSAAELAGGGHPPGAVHEGGRLRGARGPRLHRGRRDPRQPAAGAPLHAGAVLQVLGADGGTVWRCALRRRKHAGDRAPLQPGAGVGKHGAVRAEGADRGYFGCLSRGA